MAEIIDGKATADRIIDRIASVTDTLKKEGGRAPTLAVVLVGDNPASRSYVRGKMKASARAGIDGETVQLDADITEDELLAKIRELNESPDVDGILVQLPLPGHIDEHRVIESISIEKDVDGFHPLNVARLWLNEECTVPCTPKGIIRLIEESGIGIEGRRAVVVGRSNIVGKPVAKLLLDRNATVTLAHSRSRDLASVCREADILVVAVGKAGMVTGGMIKEGATVIDVGINRDPETGKLCGDVDFESAGKVAGHITPVPGGVGPMTIAMLMENTLELHLGREGISLKEKY